MIAALMPCQQTLIKCWQKAVTTFAGWMGWGHGGFSRTQKKSFFEMMLHHHTLKIQIFCSILTYSCLRREIVTLPPKGTGLWYTDQFDNKDHMKICHGMF